MIGYLAAGVALLGSSFAAYLDLKTTEVPDSVSVTVAAVGVLVHGYLSVVNADIWFLGSSLITGAALFSFGWFLYMIGAWGGADAFVLGSLGFAVPYVPAGIQPLFTAPWPFPLTMLVNVFIVGAVYTFAYSVYHGLRREEVFERLFDDMRGYWRRIIVIVGFYLFVALAVAAYMRMEYGISMHESAGMLAFYVPLLAGLLILYRYLKIVEDVTMLEEVDVEELEEGDVLAEDVITEDGIMEAERIVGLTEEQVERVREARSRVAIKHGIRFVPAFPAGLAVSLVVGDLLFAAVSLLP